MNILLNTLWFFRTIKYVLFWVYLWQLKEYHIPRFIDHFTTHKGKKLLTNPLQSIKILVVLFLAFYPELFFICFVLIFTIYTIESVIFARQIFYKSFKKPVKTPKTLLLFSVCVAVITTFLIFISAKLSDKDQIFWLISFDVVLPLIASAIVLLAQPFFVIIRNNILKQAEEKIKQHKNLKVIAITGSYGKTTTKEFLATILSAKYNVLKTKEHQNSEMGIAKCILEELKSEHEIFVVEMGSYQKGGIKLLCDMVDPQIGIVTGVNEQHLSLFGSLKNLLSAEGGQELAEALPENGLLVLNGDNKYCLDLYKKTHKAKKTYSINRGKISSDIWAEDISFNQNSVSFTAVNKQKEIYRLKADVLGKQNIQNLLAAILVAKELGITFDKIALAMSNIKSEHSGITLKKNKLNINIIDSSYSSNPDGVLADLDYLNIFSGKKIIIMPCLIELGNKSAEIHEKLGQKIGKICDIAIITTKEHFENIKKGAIYSGMEEKNIIFCENPNDIYSIITLRSAENDAVLLEGRVPLKLFDFLSK
jgi:UDP-N-acetylmuramoyl-tripeptide--D-alanyl-D-alanine ligase